MTNAERFKLLYGPYRTPKVTIGTVLTCESRDCDVIVVGYTDARIPWPVGRQRGRAARGPVVYGELAEAVRRESGIAICYWWGVTGQTATKWRKALGVEQYTDGTRRLKRDYFKEPWARNAQRKGWAKARDPERCAKIAAAKKGKPHSPELIEKLRKAHLGKHPSTETRQKMREAAKRRGAWPPAAGRPWTAEEDRLLRTLPAMEVALRTGRTLTAVYSRRTVLGMPDGRTRPGSVAERPLPN